MSNSLSTWSIRNPVPAIVLFLVLVLCGIAAYKAMPVSNMPSFSVPLISVTVVQPGASPEELESQITRKIENAVFGLQGIKHVSSKLSLGVSTTTIEFRLEVDIDRAFIDTRSAIANIRTSLPQNIDEPLVKRIEVDGGPVATYTVIAPEENMQDTSYFIDEQLSRELLAIPGVAQVTRLGGVEREITIELSPEKLSAFGVNAADVSRQLSRVHQDMPGGRLMVQQTEYMLRTLANLPSVQHLQRLSIPLANGSHLKLGDIATITDGGAELRTISRLDGKPVVSFFVYRTKDSSEIDVVKAVDQHLQAYTEKNPGTSFTRIFSLAKFTETTFYEALRAFFEGAILTIIVMFIFLREKRSTLIAAVTIPLSIIPTFAVMHFLGFSINGVSLLAISLVTGVLVDDAIVEIENIHRHMSKATKAYDAAIVAADEIGLAVIATTAVICAVFTPVGFMPGVIGQIFKQFGLTVAIAAFFSLLVARLLTPMLCAYLLKDAPHDPKEQRPSRIRLWYKKLVIWTLQHRLATLGLALISLVASFGMIPFLSMGFIPKDDLSSLSLKLELPYGSTLEQTDAIAQQISSNLKKRKEVLFVLATVNGGIFGSNGVHQASIEITLVPPEQRNQSQDELNYEIVTELQQIPDVRVGFANIEGNKDLNVTFKSNNDALLWDTVKQIEKELRLVPGITSLTNTMGQYQPEIIVRPKFAQAAELGVTTEQISQALLVTSIGDIDAMLPKFTDGSRQVPIRIRLPKQAESSIDVLQNMTILTSQGASVPLSAVAEFSISAGPTTIERYEGQRQISLQANLNGIALGDAMEAMFNLPTVKNLPEGVALQEVGDAEFMAEMNASFSIAILTGLLLVYAVQVLLYKDWIQPFTRMAALPLSIGGAFVFLLITNTELCMPSIIGMLTLMGISDKNSILLVDYMLEKVHAGMPKHEAIIEGCMVRARPIIMTSLAMMAGMLPIALGIGTQSSFRAPMAIAVIGGLFHLPYLV